MNGDLSLSRALGGLRIANPDDSVGPSSSREPSLEPESLVAASTLNAASSSASSSTSASAQRHPEQQHKPPPLQQPQSQTSQSPVQQEQRPPIHLARSYTDEPTPSIPQATSNLNPHNPSPRPPQQGSQYPPPNNRPISAVYPSQMHPRPETGPSPYRTRPPGQAPGPSNYGPNQPYPTNMPSREPSQRDRQNMPMPPPGPPRPGPAPPRKSSRGMTGGYHSTLPNQQQAYTGPQGLEGPPPMTSEEWQDRGAAHGVRREVDATGKTVIRHVKKGVRDFSFGRILGEGSYSTVFFATDRQTLKEYAIKVLEKKHIIKEKKIKYVNIEKNTLNRLTEHPGIVRLYYTFQDETSLYYVLDLCNGGELLGVLKKTGTFDEECAQFYGAQILDAVEYMHSRGVIHRDLKPENLLLDENMHIKITDFGTAKLLDDPRAPQGSNPAIPDGRSDRERASSFVGTAEYVSPELLTDKNACKASDLWAFGCIIYQLLAGRPPFKAGSEFLTFQKIVNLEFDYPRGFPPAARDLIDRCLVLDPARRLTIEHIKNHEFFDGQEFGRHLWRSKAPRLKPYVPPTQEPKIIPLSPPTTQPPVNNNRLPPQAMNGGSSRPARIITELFPPTPLDIEWSPVLTKNNERILKLGDLMVISSPIPNGSHNRGEDGPKKLSRFFGGSTTKKRQRLVMVTTSGRIVLAPAGGDEKRAKQDISLLGSDCTWKLRTDPKGQVVWCVDSHGIHYVFEEPKNNNAASDSGLPPAQDWVDNLERAREMGLSQNATSSYNSDTGLGEMSSSMSSPASTLGGKATYPEGFGASDRTGRNHLSKNQTSADGDNVKRNRFSKRQSKSGLGVGSSAF